MGYRNTEEHRQPVQKISPLVMEYLWSANVFAVMAIVMLAFVIVRTGRDVACINLLLTVGLGYLSQLALANYEHSTIPAWRLLGLVSMVLAIGSWVVGAAVAYF